MITVVAWLPLQGAYIVRIQEYESRASSEEGDEGQGEGLAEEQ